jgi:hypothetical protein
MAPTHLISNPKSGLETAPHRVPLTDGATIASRGGEIAVVQTNGDTTKSTGDMTAPPPTSWASQTGSLTASTMEQTDAVHSHPLAARSARAIGSLTPQVDLSPREGFGPAGTVMAGSTDDARPTQAPPDPRQMPMTVPQASSEGSPPITVKSRHEGAFEHHVNTPKIGEALPLSQTHAPPCFEHTRP